MYISKIATIFCAGIILSACATTRDVHLVTKTIPVAVPLIYSPAPPVVVRPDLPHLTIVTVDQKVDGRVVLAYAGSIQALIGYSEQLEDIIAQYKTINDSYAQLRTKLIADWKTNTGTDITIADPTTGAITSKSGTTSVPTSTTLGTPVSVPSVGDLVNHP